MKLLEISGRRNGSIKGDHNLVALTLPLRSRDVSFVEMETVFNYGGLN